MSNEQTVRQPAEPTSISIHNDAEIRHWMARFHCTREDLFYAVKKIGTSAFKVEAYLKRR